MSRRVRVAAAITISIVVVWAAFSAGFISGNVAADQGFRPLAQLAGEQPPEPPAGFDDVDFTVFWEAWTAIQDNIYNGPIDPEVLREGAINGVAEATEDRHTVYQNAADAQRSRERLRGSFDGVGIRVQLKDGIPFVITPLPGSPAERAGIQPNEFVVAVDGVETEGMTLAEFGELVRGEQGTTVVLTMRPEDSDVTRDVPVERARILVPSVTTETFDTIEYIRIANFGSRTANELREVMDAIESRDITAIVLDLRNNPGGLLDTSVEVAAQFLAKGQTILIQESRDEPRTRWRVQDDGGDITTPMIVLVNAGSASASEIVAGALQAHDRAQLMGEETFGKGSMQELHQLSDESVMRVTSGIWITPDDVNLGDEGLMPDVPMESSDGPFGGEDDEMLQAALALLRGEVAPGSATDLP